MTDLAKILTAKEHEAWLLIQRGMSERTAALALDITRSTLRARLENARRKIARHERGKAA